MKLLALKETACVQMLSSGSREKHTAVPVPSAALQTSSLRFNSKLIHYSFTGSYSFRRGNSTVGHLSDLAINFIILPAAEVQVLITDWKKQRKQLNFNLNFSRGLSWLIMGQGEDHCTLYWNSWITTSAGSLRDALLTDHILQEPGWMSQYTWIHPTWF